jgi:hypothetical protein
MVHFLALSLRAPGILAVRGLRAPCVQAGFLPLPAMRPRPPLLRCGVFGGGSPREPPRRRAAIPGELRWPREPCDAAAALSRAPRCESDASASRAGAALRDGARLAGDERHGGAARDRGHRPCHRSRSKGITILAKNTAVTWQGVKINGRGRGGPAARSAESLADSSGTRRSPAPAARSSTAVFAAATSAMKRRLPDDRARVAG